MNVLLLILTVIIGLATAIGTFALAGVGFAAFWSNRRYVQIASDAIQEMQRSTEATQSVSLRVQDLYQQAFRPYVTVTFEVIRQEHQTIKAYCISNRGLVPAEDISFQVVKGPLSPDTTAFLLFKQQGEQKRRTEEMVFWRGLSFLAPGEARRYPLLEPPVDAPLFEIVIKYRAPGKATLPARYFEETRTIDIKELHEIYVEDLWN